jgi:SHS family lactate transporter-like MFS transporter
VLITALTFQLVYPLLSAHPAMAWRAMFWISVIPALLALWMSTRVNESPVWLDRQKALASDRAQSRLIHEPSLSLIRILQRDLIWNTLHASFVVGGLICAYYSITFWYATLLRQASRPTLPYFAAFNIGAIAGNVLWGRVSETRLGRRGAVSSGLILAAACIPIYLHGTTLILLLGAALMGLGGTGVNGVMPAYLSERFPTAARSVGVGFTYHAGAAIGSFMPLALGAMQDRGTPLATAMSWAILFSCLFTIAVLWIVPEMRGRDLTAS